MSELGFFFFVQLFDEKKTQKLLKLLFSRMTHSAVDFVNTTL